jgi:AcrR family transcriptional regulator
MSPRTPKQFKEMREEKKTLIMDVALEHFAKEGYHNTTITHIARHAGISKGLMYNYFESKEELLTEIVNRSMEGVAAYIDPDKDGALSEAEFELFIRKLFFILREKISFWRLFYQLLMQNAVRSQLVESTLGSVKHVDAVYSDSSSSFLSIVTGMISEYFFRKTKRMPEDYDPVLDMNMFIYTVEGFAMVTVYMDEVDDISYQKTINRIIELYK